jgi:hypothetical protein
MFARVNRMWLALRYVVASLITAACVLLSPLGLPNAFAEETYVIVHSAPPAPPSETVPPRPSARHIWVPGYWTWDGTRHTWMPGHYVASRRGFVYVPPRWEAVGNGDWRYYPGGWLKR